MITVVVGKEIEKIKGDFESYLNGLNMVGEIPYSQYSELYDEGTKQIQKAYELGKAELEKENAELKAKNKWYSEQVCNKECAEVWGNLTKAKELLNEFMRISKASDEDFEHDYSELIGEAEQFISEVEK